MLRTISVCLSSQTSPTAAGVVDLSYCSAATCGTGSVSGDVAPGKDPSREFPRLRSSWLYFHYRKQSRTMTHNATHWEGAVGRGTHWDICLGVTQQSRFFFCGWQMPRSRPLGHQRFEGMCSQTGSRSDFVSAGAVYSWAIKSVKDRKYVLPHTSGKSFFSFLTRSFNGTRRLLRGLLRGTFTQVLKAELLTKKHNEHDR